MRVALKTPLPQKRLDFRGEELLRKNARKDREASKDPKDLFHARSLLSISRAAFITSTPTLAKVLFGIRPATAEAQTTASR
jgi:hypothetical protein